MIDATVLIAITIALCVLQLKADDVVLVAAEGFLGAID